MIKRFGICFGAALLIGIVLPVRIVAQDGVKLWMEQEGVQEAGLQKIGIWCDSKGVPLVGVDLVLNYDPEKMEVFDMGSEGVFAAMSGRKIDSVSGVARLSLSNSFSEYTAGNKKIAWITVKLLGTSGRAELNFDFQIGRTTETNVVTKQGKDVLANVSGLKIVQLGSRAGKTAKVNEKMEKQGEVRGEQVVAVVGKEDENSILWVLACGIALIVVGVTIWFKKTKIEQL